MAKFTHQNNLPKFLEIYLNFTENERKKFIKLAGSTYFNRKRNNKPLLNEINRIIKNHPQLMNGNIQEHIIKKTGLSKRALWNRFSELTGVAEYFLILDKIERSKLLRKRIIVEALQERKQNHALELQKIPALKLAEEAGFDMNAYYNLHSIFEYLSINFSEMNRYEESAKFNKLQSEYSILQFLVLIFKQALDLELQLKNNIATPSPIVSEVLDRLDYHGLMDSIRLKFPELSIPADIYYSLYLAFKEQEREQHYFTAKNIFLKHSSRFNPDLKNDIYQALRNYCIDKTNKGKSEYYAEIFELNNRVLDEGLFKDLNVVNSQTNNFRNFIFAAIRLNKFEWIKNFITEYSGELPGEIRGDEVNLSKGILSLYEKKYTEALGYLKKVNRKRYLQYLDTGVYKLIIFYETEDIEEAYKESARIKNYILKHKDIPSYLKGSYQRFIKKFLELLKLSQKADKTDIEIFTNELSAIKNIGLGSWLYEKGKEMLGNAK